MLKQQFSDLMGRIAGALAGKPLDADMEAFLNDSFPPDGPDFSRLKQLCREGEENGWLMTREARGIKYGRDEARRRRR